MKTTTVQKLKYILILLTLSLSVNSCKFYNFTGGNVGAAETFHIPQFQNYATQSPGSIFEPGMDRDFTLALQNRIQDQTTLSYTTNPNADLVYEGEIMEYRISPMSATAEQTAAQNRLSIAVQVRFTNTTIEDGSKDFEQRFSFFYDYDAASQLSSVKTEAHEVIFERITQDIFNASLADW